jgi:hypothetical protein
VFLFVEKGRETRRATGDGGDRADDGGERRRRRANQDGADEILLRRLVPGESSRLLPFSPPP